MAPWNRAKSESCAVLPKSKTETLSFNSDALEFNQQVFLFVLLFFKQRLKKPISDRWLDEPRLGQELRNSGALGRSSRVSRGDGGTHIYMQRGRRRCAESRRRALAEVLLTLSVWKITPAGTWPRLLTKTPTFASYCLLARHTLPTCANRWGQAVGI